MNYEAVNKRFAELKSQLEELKYDGPYKYYGVSKYGTRMWARYNWFHKSWTIKWDFETEPYFNPFEGPEITGKLKFICGNK